LRGQDGIVNADQQRLRSIQSDFTSSLYILHPQAETRFRSKNLDRTTACGTARVQQLRIHPKRLGREPKRNQPGTTIAFTYKDMNGIDH
jgi:hypothetical protein